MGLATKCRSQSGAVTSSEVATIIIVVWPDATAKENGSQNAHMVGTISMYIIICCLGLIVGACSIDYIYYWILQSICHITNPTSLNPLASVFHQQDFISQQELANEMYSIPSKWRYSNDIAIDIEKS